MMRTRARIIKQREAPPVDKTDNPIVPSQKSLILGFAIGTSMNVTGADVVCGINLF